MTCKQCGRPIDQERIQKELRIRTQDIPETCARAAKRSVFCGLTCALEDFATSRKKGPKERLALIIGWSLVLLCHLYLIIYGAPDRRNISILFLIWSLLALVINVVEYRKIKKERTK
jgi:hypothetical protein